MTERLIALNCPQCNAPLGDGLVCAYCSTRSERVSAPNKPRTSVTGENRNLQVGGITFDRRVGLDDRQLEAIASQVAVGMAATETEPAKHFLDFSLPLPKKAGRPPALIVEAYRGDEERVTVLLGNPYIEETDQRLRALGRIITLPTE